MVVLILYGVYWMNTYSANESAYMLCAVQYTVYSTACILRDVMWDGMGVQQKMGGWSIKGHTAALPSLYRCVCLCVRGAAAGDAGQLRCCCSNQEAA